MSEQKNNTTVSLIGKDKKEILKAAISPDEDNDYANLNINNMKESLDNNGKESEIINTNNITDVTPTETYFSLGDEQSGFFEADLIAFREKGQETRYLSLKVIGFDLEQEKQPPVAQTCSISIRNKEEFEALKYFFSNLNWND